jgi:hypothetical protein
VSGFDLAGHAINLVTAAVDAVRLIEHAVFGENLVDSRAAAHRVVFTKDIVKIALQ